MTFLPIVERELRVSARRPGTYWGRMGSALAAIGIGGWIMFIPGLRTPHELGLTLFIALSIIAFIFSLLIGVATTADCLSEEKREGTLGLLFLTDLKGYDIVFGKLAATSFNGLYGMLAIFPVMAIPLLMGGVTGAEFWRVVLVSTNNLFFSLAVGMFCSAISRDERKALVLAVLIIVLLTVVVPLIYLLILEIYRAKGVRTLWEARKLMLIPSPGFACFFAFDGTFSNSIFKGYNFFYESVACIHSLGWALLVATCFIVPRTWQDKAGSPAASSRQERWRRWAYGAPPGRQTRRTRMLETNPFYWLTARDRLKAAFVWGFLGACGLLWLWGFLAFKRGWLDQGVYVVTAFLIHSVLKLWVASEACRRLCMDRRSGALELLLSTPLTVKKILNGQMLALWQQFAGPLFVVLVADTIFISTHRAEADWLRTWAAAVIMLLADLITLSWVGMWLGLRSRRANRALAAAVARILVLPWGVFLLALFILKYAAWENDSLGLVIWIGIGLITDVVFGVTAYRNLQGRFREVATQRFESGRAKG